MTLDPKDAKEALRLLAQGRITVDDVASDDEETLRERMREGIAFFFRTLATFAERGESIADRCAMLRHYVEGEALATRPDGGLSRRSASIDRERVEALFASDPREDSEDLRRGEIDPAHLLLAADRLLRGSDAVGGRAETDFSKMEPRDFGVLYEGFFNLRPEIAARDEGGPFLRWASDSKSRKASGQFYTPEPIARRIVASALEPLWEEWIARRSSSDHATTTARLREAALATASGESANRKRAMPFALRERTAPLQAPPFRALDPAMGSGFFLIAAGDFLYRRKLLEEDEEPDETRRRALRREIARTCLYGTDKDPVAAMLARLSLTAWAESRIVAKSDPAVAAHLKVGNSLVGPPPEREAMTEARSGEFRWTREFPEAFSGGAPGFDAVIGNPPYDNSRGGMSGDPEFARLAAYARKNERYKIRGAVDHYRLFLQRAMELCREGGIVSMIVPRTLLGDREATIERRMLLDETTILQVEDFPHDDVKHRVFPSAALGVCIVTAKRGGETRQFPLRRWSNGALSGEPETRIVRREIAERFWPETLPFAGMRAEERELLERIADASWIRPLSEIADGAIGEMNSGYHKRFMVSERTDALLIRGADVSPYHIERGGTFKRWADREGFFATLTEKARSGLRWNEWRVAKQAIRNLSMTKRIVAALVEPGCLLADSTDFFAARPPYDPRYVLALLNSDSVPEWLFQAISANHNVSLYQTREIPVPRIDFNVSEEARARLASEAIARTCRLSERLKSEKSNEAAWREWIAWLLPHLPDARTHPAGASVMLHDLIVRLAQELTEIRREEENPESILERGDEIRARRKESERMIDLIIWGMYDLRKFQILIR